MNANEEILSPPCDESVIVPSAGAKSAGKRNLTLLMLVLAAGTGTATMFTKHGPQSSYAAGVTPPGSTSTDARTRQPARSAAEKSPVLTDDIVAKVRFSPADVQVPLADLKCDPFTLATNSAQPKILPDDPIETQRREQERQSALDAVQSLHLESVQRDESHRACTINGVLYQEGQEVDGFVIEEIAASSVVVRKGVYRFELRVR